jgi:hypothetical protein
LLGARGLSIDALHFAPASFSAACFHYLDKGVLVQFVMIHMDLRVSLWIFTMRIHEAARHAAGVTRQPTRRARLG